jgi:hypothetical protein
MSQKTSIRLPEPMSDALDRADINKSSVARKAFIDELLNRTVGVCAVTGQRCYMGDFATVGNSTPLGNRLGLPTSVENVDMVDSMFERLSGQIAAGETLDINQSEMYINTITPTVYRAEVEYLAAIGSHSDEIAGWGRAVLKRPTDPTEWNDLRLYCLLRWMHRENPDSSVFCLRSVWEAHPQSIRQQAIGRLQNDPGDASSAILDALGV